MLEASADGFQTARFSSGTLPPEQSGMPQTAGKSMSSGCCNNEYGTSYGR
jgi:hypothetical protein